MSMALSDWVMPSLWPGPPSEESLWFYSWFAEFSCGHRSAITAFGIFITFWKGRTPEKRDSISGIVSPSFRCRSWVFYKLFGCLRLEELRWKNSKRLDYSNANGGSKQYSDHRYKKLTIVTKRWHIFIRLILNHNFFSCDNMISEVLVHPVKSCSLWQEDSETLH